MLPKGTRDFLPEDMRKRDHITELVQNVFERYSFQKIETPAIELNKTLSGKYGEEGDRLMFKLLPRGRKLENLANKDLSEIQSSIEEAMRYDLTVPFARFVVDHRNDLVFPFKRYQIQNVWRADRPQKGRYREFTQCDADVVGVAGLVQDAELLHIYDEVFQSLGLAVTIHINHRVLLQALVAEIGAEDKLVPFTVALDKLDKVGWEGVSAEWDKFNIQVSDRIRSLIEGNWDLSHEGIDGIKSSLKEGELRDKAIADLNELLELLNASPLKHSRLKLDLTLARGLDYYTGFIFEVKANDAQVGSIGGGGRYDELTSVFGLKDMPGVGISFGLDRIQLAMEQLDLFDKKGKSIAQVLVAHMGETEQSYNFLIAQRLRQEGIATELYPKDARLKKQIDFATKSNIPFLLIVGQSEREKGTVNLKILETGEQRELLMDNLIPFFNQLLK
jgi:histidyl-tRNA synthetase